MAVLIITALNVRIQLNYWIYAWANYVCSLLNMCIPVYSYSYILIVAISSGRAV